MTNADATSNARRDAIREIYSAVRAPAWADGWNGFFVPAKTPREVIDRLQRETAAAVRHPETARRLMEIGAEPVGSTPAEQDAILKRQVQQFRPVIKEMKIEN